MRRIGIGYTLWPGDFELSDPGPWLDEAERLGVDIVEVPFFTTRVIVDAAVSERALARFARPFEGRDLAVSAHAMLSINLMDAPERLPLHEAVLKANIALAARLGARRLVVHCGMTDAPEGPAREDAHARQRESLARMGDVAAAHEVTLCVETVWSHDGRATALPSRLAAELRRVDHPRVGATLDFAHVLLQCGIEGADFMEEVAAIAPLAAHLHLNDCFGVERDVAVALPAEAAAYGTGDLHLPLGWGGIPWERVLTEPTYPSGDLTLVQELHPGFGHALADDVKEMRRLRSRMERAPGGD